MPHDVFISYSSKDKITADAVCATLEANGIRCWIAPRDVLPGMEYAEALVEALHDSRLLVLVFSAGANASVQVRQEVERAVSSGLTILPFRIEDVPPNRAMEFFISGRHWLDALTPPLEAHLQELSRTVKLLLARGDAAPVPGPVPPLPVPVPIPSPSPIPAPLPPAPVPTPTPHPIPAVLPNWLLMTKKQALVHIRNAWIAGLAAAGLTFIVGMAAANGTSMIQGMDASTLQLAGYVDVTIILVLSFGIFKRIRGCAIAMLLYFFISKLIQFTASGLGNPFGALIALGLTYVFFQGVRGTSAYKIMKDAWSQPEAV